MLTERQFQLLVGAATDAIARSCEEGATDLATEQADALWTFIDEHRDIYHREPRIVEVLREGVA